MNTIPDKDEVTSSNLVGPITKNPSKSAGKQIKTAGGGRSSHSAKSPKIHTNIGLTECGKECGESPLISALTCALPYKPICAVYFMTRLNGAVAYVGSTCNLGRRMGGSHRIKKYKRYRHVFYVEVEEWERYYIENVFIAIFNPIQNRHRDRLWCMISDPCHVDQVVERFFGGRWDLVPPRDVILSRQMNLHDFTRRGKLRLKENIVSPLRFAIPIDAHPHTHPSLVRAGGAR